MTDAFEQGNQETGQPQDNVGQDESINQQENSQDWEQQAKYFQSEKDKLQAENQKLKDYEKVGKFLESRPDIVETIKQQASGQPQQQTAPRIQKPKEFDAWEAYNDPSSESYKYRMQEMNDAIQSGVTEAVKGVTAQQQQSQAKIEEQVATQKLESELAARGLNQQEVNEFMNFAAKNPAEYGIDSVIQMWRSVQGNEQIPANQQTNPLDQIRQTQESPASGGVLQGQQPKAPKNDMDNMWDGIMSAGRRTNVLK